MAYGVGAQRDECVREPQAQRFEVIRERHDLIRAPSSVNRWPRDDKVRAWETGQRRVGLPSQAERFVTWAMRATSALLQPWCQLDDDADERKVDPGGDG